MASAKYGAIDQQTLMSQDTTPNDQASIELNDQAHPGQAEAMMVDPFDPFNEKPLTEEFWINANREFIEANKDKANVDRVPWMTVVTELRLAQIIRKYEARVPEGDRFDILVELLTSTHDGYRKKLQQANLMDLLPNFVKQLSEFAQCLLKQGEPAFLNPRGSSPDELRNLRYYGVFQSSRGATTILHLAAERNLVEIAKLYIKQFPGKVYATVRQGAADKTPLEVALDKVNDPVDPYPCDDVASLLVKNMAHERVRGLFEATGGSSARCDFTRIVDNPNMKNTVIAILDACINPDWPFLQSQDGARKGSKSDAEDMGLVEAWEGVVDMPLRYHFYFRILDGDALGEPALLKGKPNPDFNHRPASALQRIVEGGNSKEAVRHPVVRHLVRRKWELYARDRFMMYFGCYLSFLVMMSLALFLSTGAPSWKYEHPKEIFRGFCEIVTLIFLAFYLLSELDQMMKEGRKYWMDMSNCFDLTGLVLLLVVAALHFTQYKSAESCVASLAYLFNFLRVFKFFPGIHQQISIYSKTIAQIIYYDITKFALVYLLVMMAFTGSVYLALSASRSTASTGFWEVFLKEIRALTETNPFNDSYASYHWALVVLLMINMFAIIVILSNILIGQLSYRYEQALGDASVQYDVDRAKIVTRTERSWFRMWNPRIKYYADADFVSDKERLADYLEEWAKLDSALETSPERFRPLIERRLQKRKVQ